MDNDGDAPSDVKPNTLHATPSQWQPNEDIDLEFRPIPGEGAQPKRSISDRFRRIAFDARTKLQTAGAAAKAQSAVGISAIAKPLSVIKPALGVTEKKPAEPPGPLYTDVVTETYVAQYGANPSIACDNVTRHEGDRRAYEGYTENMDIYHELGPNKWFGQPKGPRPMPQEWTAVAS